MRACTGELSVGIPRIDFEHEILLTMISDFEQARINGFSEDLLQDQLLEIAAFAKYQFLHEENMLMRRGFADLHVHCEKHAQFMDMIFNITLSRKLGLSRYADAGELLSNWIVAHIREEDSKYAAYGPVPRFAAARGGEADCAPQRQAGRVAGTSIWEDAYQMTSAG